MRRTGLVRSLIGVVGLLVVACLGVAIWVWNSNLSLDQRLVAVGDTLAAGGLCLAILASLVAVLAYRVSVQRPILAATVKADGREPIEVGLAGPDAEGERRIERLPAPGPQKVSVPLVLGIQNVSEWSARNVAVRVELKGMRGVGVPLDWSRAAVDGGTGQTTALNWEGGADYAIHGNWTRELPPIELSGLIVDPPLDSCELLVEVVVEGFRKTWTFPVRCVSQPLGSIEGYAGYPSSGVPSLRVYAIPLRAGLAPQRVTIPNGPGGKLRWFRFEKLEPGEYHVLAYREGYPDLAGAYTVASTKDDFTEHADHTLVKVVVEAFRVAENVRITDWYSRDFPPEPRTKREQILGLHN